MMSQGSQTPKCFCPGMSVKWPTRMALHLASIPLRSSCCIMRSSRYICSPISSMNSTVGVSKSGCSGVPIAEQSSERLPPASRPRAVRRR